MSVLRKICGVTGRDRRRNLNILKELDIHKDIVQVRLEQCLCGYPAWQVLLTRRLTYFVHVTRMGSDRYPHLLLQSSVVVQKEDRGRSCWTTSVTTARRWAFQSMMRLHNSLPTGQDGGTLYAIWAASAHWQRHCRHGNKSSRPK